MDHLKVVSDVTHGKLQLYLNALSTVPLLASLRNAYRVSRIDIDIALSFYRARIYREQIAYCACAQIKIRAWLVKVYVCTYHPELEVRPLWSTMEPRAGLLLLLILLPAGHGNLVVDLTSLHSASANSTCNQPSCIPGEHQPDALVDGDITTWWQSQTGDQPVLLSLQTTQVSPPSLTQW